MAESKPSVNADFKTWWIILVTCILVCILLALHAIMYVQCGQDQPKMLLIIRVGSEDSVQEYHSFVTPVPPLCERAFEHSLKAIRAWDDVKDRRAQEVWAINAKRLRAEATVLECLSTNVHILTHIKRYQETAPNAVEHRQTEPVAKEL